MNYPNNSFESSPQPGGGNRHDSNVCLAEVLEKALEDDVDWATDILNKKLSDASTIPVPTDEFVLGALERNLTGKNRSDMRRTIECGRCACAFLLNAETGSIVTLPPGCDLGSAI